MPYFRNHKPPGDFELNETSNSSTTGSVSSRSVSSAEVSDISLAEVPGKPKKPPRRLIYFSDGILEEYSTDEEEAEEEQPQQTIVDASTLAWMPWFKYRTVSTASHALTWVDYFGEKLAWFFGITTPKYQYAIDEYNRLKQEEEEEKLREEKEHEAQQKRLEEGDCYGNPI